ncbi:STAS domain-containing protein [Rhodanobacter sp. MP7CTX1]|uniref:STAS domain-containing protein n=1 Tax=Rhodanobacter sp. MP7CTX1 TaxID=2723084 RepID=UPI0017BF16CF|nr:anti-anti-sigma regulatory factor [Rhodanobacter sp. MP7CTX1]
MSIKAKAAAVLADKFLEKNSDGVGRMGGGSKNVAAAAAAKAAAVIGLPADCRMAELPALRDQFLLALAAPLSTLEASGVERVDTAALQLLVAFHRDALARGQQVAWASVSAPLRDAAERLGLTKTLALPAATPA